MAVLVPVAVMFALGLWGLDRGGIWRDEAATFQVARRSPAQIWRMLHHVDAVHGLYYLLMHGVLALRPGEVLLRLPSVCGAAATAGLVAALGTRLCRPRVGLWAGLLYAVTPMVGHYAQEGRSYALVAAGVAGATLLLLRAVRGGSWWPYGLVLAVTCLLHEFAVLVLLAHACTLALARVPGRVWRGWACAAGAVAVLLLPLALVSRGQSAQVAWLTPPDGRSAERLLREFAGPSWAVLGPCLVLMALAVRGPGAWRGPSPAGVALPLMLVPPAVLMAVSLISPLYDDRYVLYSLAGAPLLVAAGAERVAGVLRRSAGATPPAAHGGCPGTAGVIVRGPAPLAPRRPVPHGTAVAVRERPGVPASGARPVLRRLSVPRARAVPGRPPAPGARPAGRRHLGALVGAVLVCGVLVVQFPLLRADRRAANRPDDLAAVSAAVGRTVRPGDPVLFLPSLERRSALAYPAGFRGVRDVALDVPAAAGGTLYGREVGPRELRRRLGGLGYVWVVGERYALRPSWTPWNATDRAKLAVVREEFVTRAEYVHRGVTLRLYVRPRSTPESRSAPPRPASGSARRGGPAGS
ncbi:glycosyltransferase family 39 protein [Streptomyces sp. NPDC052036]|uniref:glycosyltransferase family 39 protein n=1 Tax=Streptomyces sp. NPDC052036 TaxID=3155171 RepID=UPI003447A540